MTAATTGASSPPVTLGRFVVESELARGGCGVIHLARDPASGRRVAIKRAVTDAHGDRADNDERILAEASVLRAVAGDAVIELLEVGDHDDQPFLVLELAERGSLGARLSAGRRGDPWSTVAVARCLARALTPAHGRSIVHRDVNPANLLLVGSGPDSSSSTLVGSDERLVLADFGVAATASELERGPWRESGTRLFRAPEQAEAGHPVGSAVDVHGATAVVVSAISGALPPSPDELPGWLAELRPRWRDFVATGMAADPSRRHPSMTDWFDALLDAVNHDLARAGHAPIE